ncbi:MAG: bile acid:sodium symporter family protein [Eubacterium sp.]|nr:bile acid:sodium symporter family protein [Eubacterium sp.]
MNLIKRISNFVVYYFIVLIVILSLIAFFVPNGFAWMTKYTAVFLGMAMFGMGTTIDLHNLRNILIRPKEIIIGVSAQFVLMPVLAWILCVSLGLPKEIAIGVILVGACPGGTASNVMTHIAGGDVTLSVAMTTVSTLLAPFLTPLLVYLFAGAWVQVSLTAMFVTVVKVILVPVILGIIVSKMAGENMKQIDYIFPLISSLAIIFIISGIIALNSDKIVQSGILVTMVVLAHNLLGLLAGLAIAKIFRLEYKKATAMAIEVGMQNSGLAVSLAAVNFAANPLATLPGAIFSVMHNLTGSIFAKIRKRGYILYPAPKEDVKAG